MEEKGIIEGKEEKGEEEEEGGGGGGKWKKAVNYCICWHMYMHVNETLSA